MNHSISRYSRVVHMAAMITVLSAFAAGSVLAAGAKPLDPQFQSILSYAIGDSTYDAPMRTMHDMVRAAYGDPVRELAIEKQFVRMLDADPSYDCVDFICKQLWVFGTGESVPALAKLLVRDAKYADIARLALQENRAPAAGKALLAAMGKTTGTQRIGIVNSLGERREASAVQPLARLAKGADDATARAVVDALAKIGGPDAVTALQAVRAEGTAPVKDAAAKALLATAYTLGVGGDMNAAAAIYRSLDTGGVPAQVRAAVQKQLKR